MARRRARTGLTLTRSLDAFVDRVEGIGPARAAAEAMNEVMRKATADRIGGDLRMSNFRGPPVDFVMTVKPTEARLRLGGATYALADRGRHSRRRRFRPRQKDGLFNTPWGPRRSIKASTWDGFGITAGNAD